MMAVSNQSSTPKGKATIYEKLNTLSEEITERILEVGSLSAIPIPREVLLAEIEELRDISFRERSPEAEFALQLFYKYNSMASTVMRKKSHVERKTTAGYDTQKEDSTFVGKFLEGQGEQLQGLSALNKSIFWLRIGSAIFSFISFVVMATVPNIDSSRFRPNQIFNKHCIYGHSVSGYFDFQPFQAVIAIGTLVFVHSTLFSIYYILPLDSNNNKFIPGLGSWMNVCLERDSFENSSTRISSFCQAFSKRIEMVIDGALVICLLTAFLVASIMLEQGSKFAVNNAGNLAIQFYTLDTFYNTFGYMYPPCVEGHPSHQIRAALAMMFISLFLMFLTLQVSTKSYFKELELAPKAVDSIPSYSSHSMLPSAADEVPDKQSSSPFHIEDEDGAGDEISL